MFWHFLAKFWPEKITSRDGCFLPQDSRFESQIAIAVKSRDLAHLLEKSKGGLTNGGLSPKFSEKIGGEILSGLFGADWVLFGAFSGPIGNDSSAPHSQGGRVEIAPKGPFLAQLAPFGPSPRLLSPRLDFPELSSGGGGARLCEEKFPEGGRLDLGFRPPLTEVSGAFGPEIPKESPKESPGAFRPKTVSGVSKKTVLRLQRRFWDCFGHFLNPGPDGPTRLFWRHFGPKLHTIAGTPCRATLVALHVSQLISWIL